MVKAILFDLWGTLFYETIEKEHPFRKFARIIGQDISDYKYLKIFEKYLMLKRYNNLKIPCQLILKHLRIKATGKIVSELTRLLTKKVTKQKPYFETFKVLKGLKEKNYKLGLITNTYYQAYKQLEEKFMLDKFFDVILKSYKVGILKPNPKIFRMAVSKLNESKNEILMVGDSLEDDVRAAEKFGIKGVLIDRKNKNLEYPNRIKSLNELKRFL